MNEWGEIWVCGVGYMRVGWDMSVWGTGGMCGVGSEGTE